MITGLITVVHLFVSAVLIIVVLLQHGKSADIAATFGGMGSQTAFGPRGTATVLSRLTTWCAIIFMVSSIALTYFGSRRGASTSVLDKVPASQTAPASPSPAAPAQQSAPVQPAPAQSPK